MREFTVETEGRVKAALLLKKKEKRERQLSEGGVSPGVLTRELPLLWSFFLSCLVLLILFPLAALFLRAFQFCSVEQSAKTQSGN